MTLISFAQNAEDIVLWRALKTVQSGFYIDVGAYHSSADSVTKLFYDNGWSGVNVEPVGDYYQELLQNRPRDLNLRVALGRSSGSRSLFQVRGTGLSTLERDIAERHVRNGFPCEEVIVPVMTLAEVHKLVGKRDVHFLKIDVEGAEREVLDGADLNQERPWIIMVEATAPLAMERTDAQWLEVLENAGYQKVLFDGLNQFFVARERSELSHLLEVPANILDAFVPARLHVVEAELETAQAELETAQAELETAQARQISLENARRQDVDQLRGEVKAERERMAALELRHEKERSEQARLLCLAAAQVGIWLSTTKLLAEDLRTEQERIRELEALQEEGASHLRVLETELSKLRFKAQGLEQDRDELRSEIVTLERDREALEAVVWHAREELGRYQVSQPLLGERLRNTARSALWNPDRHLWSPIAAARSLTRRSRRLFILVRGQLGVSSPAALNISAYSRGIVLKSGLFDPLWYVSRYPSVGGSRWDALDDFLLLGGCQGRRPHPLFHSDWYLHKNPDVARSGINPLLHYLTIGSREKRNPNPFFDVTWYKHQYPDVAESGLEPLIHYVNCGWKEGREVGPKFDASWYRNAHPDIPPDVDPLADFFERGWRKGWQAMPPGSPEAPAGEKEYALPSRLC